MVKRPRSFRRLLLLQILLLSAPILLIGQAVTLRKARTSLLDTARQNLASSAVRKAQELEQEVRTVQADLMLLSENQALRAGDAAAVQSVLDRYAATVFYEVSCLELRNGDGILATTTCDAPLLPDGVQLPWQADSGVPSFYLVSLTNEPDAVPSSEGSPIELTVAAPVYDLQDQLSYTLTAQVQIYQLEDTNPRSLVGDTVVINADSTVVVHPNDDQVGQPIEDLPAGDRLRSILGNIANGRQDTLHLFDFASPGDEWLAGYSGVNVPVTPTQAETWNVLAVTPLNQALHALKDIRQILIVLTLGLLCANALLALYVARNLSLPVERLIRYAQEVQDVTRLKAAPRHRSVWELDYLGQVLERMLRRLQAGSQELRQAWHDAQLANQTKNEFLANTSHELRTPLNGIINSVRLVRNGDCDSREEELEFLEQADRASIHLLKIINDILDIAKIEAGTVAIALAPIDVRTVLSDVLDMQSLHIRQKGLTLHRPQLPQPLLVQADVDKLKQVLLNVIYNAVKFTPTGEITVDVTAEVQAYGWGRSPWDEGDSAANGTVTKEVPLPRVVISIRDTGIGIDPKEQHKLFRPFVMVDGSRTRRYEGTGLGLAISKNLMELMGGTIRLVSAGCDQGTTVILVLPLLAKTAAEPESPDSTGAPGTANTPATAPGLGAAGLG